MHSHSPLKTVRQVSILNALSNIALAIIKVCVGWIAHSHALLADGLHSFSDLVSDGLVYFGAYAGDKHPDKAHPYGHHRIETIIAIIIAFLFLLVGAGIIRDSIRHILHHTEPHIHAIPVLIIAGLSVLMNEGLFHYTLKAGKKIQSNLLITNAWHKRSDALASIIVLLSAAGSFLKWPYLDLIGAIIIALLILKMAFTMIHKNVSELVDAAVDPNTLKKIHDAILHVNGVTSIHMLRTRMHAGHIFVDVHILVNPMISVSEGHYISDQVLKTLTETFKDIIDVTVHIDPENDEKVRPSIHSPDRQYIEARLRERWQTLPNYNHINRFIIHYLNGSISIDVFMQAPVTDLAHKDQWLKAYRAAAQDIPDITHIDLHITL